MCGRFTLKTPVADWLANLFPELADQTAQIEESLQSSAPELLQPRFNIAPSQLVLVVQRGDHKGVPVVSPMRWGLVPFWADSLNISYSMINARSETISEKKSFKSLLRSHRCVIVADGYYEWQSPERSASGAKQPYWIHAAGQTAFAMAGLWTENKHVIPGRTCRSATIITTAANDDTEPVHDRMPALLPDLDSIRRWLANDDVANVAEQRDEAYWQSQLVPCSCGFLTMHAVSTKVNSPRENGEQLIAPVAIP